MLEYGHRFIMSYMQRAIRHKQAKLIKFVLLCSIYYYYYCHAIFRFLKKYSIYLLIMSCNFQFFFIIIIMQFLGFLRNFQFTQFFINMNILKENKKTQQQFLISTLHVMFLINQVIPTEIQDGNAIVNCSKNYS